MTDSLRRIKALAPEVGIVKMADRITNLQQPPSHWDREKKKTYRSEAIQIWQQLQDCHAFLAGRLESKITEYGQFI